MFHQRVDVSSFGSKSIWLKPLAWPEGRTPGSHHAADLKIQVSRAVGQGGGPKEEVVGLQVGLLRKGLLDTEDSGGDAGAEAGAGGPSASKGLEDIWRGQYNSLGWSCESWGLPFISGNEKFQKGSAFGRIILRRDWE